MATAKPIASSLPRRRAPKVILLLALIPVAAAAWFWRPLTAYALTGASYGARLGCSCRYVEGRSIGDCRKDLGPGMELVRLSEDRQAHAVTASFALLVHQTATFHEGEGCVLEPWEN